MARKPKAQLPSEANTEMRERMIEAAREGPSAEEQAMVDAEQRDIMARFKALRDEAEAGERANHLAKIERAAVARKVMSDWQEQIEARIAALEAKG